MKNKKAIELSINFIVVIIIAIVIFGFGIVIVRQYFEFAEEEQKFLSEQQKQEVENLLRQGRKAVIASNTETISRGESHLFGLGIMNVNPDYGKFLIDVKCAKAMSKETSRIYENCISTGISQSDCPKCIRYNKEPIRIKNNEDYTEGIMIQIPKDLEVLGQYIFDVKVYHTEIKPENLYGTPQKIIVSVP